MRFEQDKIPVPEAVTGGWMRMLLQYIGIAVNQMDERNFPRPLTGDRLIKAASLSGTAIKDLSLSPKALTWPRTVYVPLLLVEPAAQTLQTTAQGIGPLFHWDPAEWPPTATWKLEATLAVDGPKAAQTANLDLFTTAGAQVAGSPISTPEVQNIRVVSGNLTMPAAATDLYCRLWTSDATKHAYCKGARLVMSL